MTGSKRRLKLFLALLFHGGVIFVSFLGRVIGMDGITTMTVLVYHDVPPERRDQFAVQLDMVMARARPVRADATKLHRGYHNVALTFDDGFSSFREVALPELLKRRIPCTLFVPTGHFGDRPWWMDPSKERDGLRTLNVEELLTLPDDLVTIGSHGIWHRDLTALKTGDARWELGESRRVLERIIRHPVSLIAFPYGAWNRRLLAMSRTAGYRMVFGGEPTFADADGSRFLRGRVDVSWDDSSVEYMLKITGAYRWLSAAIASKRAVRSSMERLMSRVPGHSG